MRISPTPAEFLRMITTTRFLSAATLALLLSAGSQVHATSETVIRVGTEPSSGPFVVMDQKAKQLTGFDIELMKAIAKAARFKLQLVPMSFDKIIPGIRSGSIDAGISSITITEERRKYLVFSEPYIQAGLGIMIRKDMLDHIHEAEDLEGHDVCAQSGTRSAKFAGSINEVGVKGYNSNAETYMALKAGKCDAIVNERPILAYYMAFAKPKDLMLLEGYVTSEEYGIAMNRNDYKVQTLINSGLEQIREDGTYQEIYEHWFAD